jgi:protein gp37
MNKTKYGWHTWNPVEVGCPSGLATLGYGILDQPIHRREPATILVGTRGDLFLPHVPDEFIQAIFTTMAQARQHTFMVLTKRPERMKTIICSWTSSGLTLRDGHGCILPNVWLGVTVENQVQADERIPLLLQTSAAKRFVSIDPMLAEIKLDPMLLQCAGITECDRFKDCGGPDARGEKSWCSPPCPTKRIDWVICGGESGPGARECREEWVCGLRDQCINARVPFFFKQTGPNFIGRYWLGGKSKNAHYISIIDWEKRREWPEVSR